MRFGAESEFDVPVAWNNPERLTQSQPRTQRNWSIRPQKPIHQNGERTFLAFNFAIFAAFCVMFIGNFG